MPPISNMWLIVSHFQILGAGLTYLSSANIISSDPLSDRLPFFSVSLSCPSLSLACSFRPNCPWPWLLLHKKQMLKALAQGATTLYQGLWKPGTACDVLIHADRTSGRAMPRQTHIVHHFPSKWSVHCSGSAVISYWDLPGYSLTSCHGADTVYQASRSHMKQDQTTLIQKLW